MIVKQSRNDPCACGSGNKFKQCCMRSTEIPVRSNGAAADLKVAASHVGEGRLQDAVVICQRVLHKDPNHPEALNLLGVLAFYAGNNALAVNLLSKAIAINGQYADAHNNLAEVFRSSGNYLQAISHLQSALKIKPNYIDALVNYGNVLQDVHEYDKSVDIYRRVLKVNSKHTGTLSNLANLLQQLNLHVEAIEIYEQLLAIDDNHDWGLGGLLYSKLNCCDWQQASGLIDKINAKVKNGLNIIKPFDLLTISHDQKQQLIVAKHFVNYQYPMRGAKKIYQYQPGNKVRIAYISADFRQHPVSQLLVEVIERHDRSQFEVIGISLGSDDQSQIRARITKAFDQFHDATDLADVAVVQLIKDLHVDIAIDLMGYTTGARMGIFSYCPAPIQVGFLGYAGTTGADFIDYIIADNVVIPSNRASDFSEKVIHLESTFMPRDSTLSLPEINNTRLQEGLPEGVFVFCSFNNHYKFNPEIFDIWMRLLNKIEGSVLWLSKANNTVKNNLAKAAEARGVSADRIIFAERTEKLEDHLARHQLADLFLDTLPYNAHTTASDALYSGLPVLTCIGNTFAGRVAASLLCAVGMDELVTNSLVEYEGLALKIAKEPKYLADIKSKLEKNKKKLSIFDTKKYTDNLERAYLQMVKVFKETSKND